MLDNVTFGTLTVRTKTHPLRSQRGTRDGSLDMCRACSYVVDMSRMIQIRNVPEELHRQLKARSAMAGMSLSDYLLKEVRQVVERPTLEELRARLQRRSSTKHVLSPARVVRSERDSR